MQNTHAMLKVTQVSSIDPRPTFNLLVRLISFHSLFPFLFSPLALDCLVNGPLTALLLLDVLSLNLAPTQTIASFEYRATHPLVVERPLSLNGAWEKNGTEVRLWALDDEGRVGMTARAEITCKPKD